MLLAVLHLVVPLGGRLSTDLLGFLFFAPDHLLDAGILEWGRRAVLTLSDPFEWPPGYPLRHSLAGTESLLGWQPAYLLLRQIGVSVAGSFNLLVLASFVVSGVAAERFARHLGVSRSGAIVSGVLFSFSHYHVALLVQFQSLSIAWMPFAFVFLDRFLRVPAWRPAVGFAATLLITGFSGIYYGVFLLALSGGWALWRALGGSISVHRRHALIAAAVGACAALAALPGVLPYLEFAVDHGYVEEPGKLAENSVALPSFLQVPRWLALWGDGALLPRVAGGGAFPGLVLTALLVASLKKCPGDVDQGGAPDALLVVLAVSCVVLFLGPYLKIYNYPTEYLGGRIPLSWMALTLPGIRIPLRWLGCSLVFLAPLAGRGFDRLTDGGVGWRLRGRVCDRGGIRDQPVRRQARRIRASGERGLSSLRSRRGTGRSDRRAARRGNLGTDALGAGLLFLRRVVARPADRLLPCLGPTRRPRHAGRRRPPPAVPGEPSGARTSWRRPAGAAWELHAEGRVRFHRPRASELRVSDDGGRRWGDRRSGGRGSRRSSPVRRRSRRPRRIPVPGAWNRDVGTRSRQRPPATW